MLRLLPLLLACMAAAHAAPQRMLLSPSVSAVGFRAYALGLWPLDGQFTRFHGWLHYDDANPADCRVELTVDVASLAMPDPAMQATVLGPDFLDAAHYPTIAFTGACQASEIDGMLDMHGVSRRLSLSRDWLRGALTAAASLRRADWGMTARPLAGGSTIRIEVVAAPPRP